MLTLSPGNLTWNELSLVYRSSQPLELERTAWDAIDASRATVQSLLERGEVIYGINTGFGLLANQRISSDQLQQLQLNLVRSHAAGCGPPLKHGIVRLVLLLKAASLARGYSGVRREVVQSLLDCLGSGLVPSIPSQGSVGASGDLAPLAHMALALLGEGEFLHEEKSLPASTVLQSHGILPLSLGPKEGLALLNGTQVSTSIALEAAIRCDRLLRVALICGALSVDAAHGSDTPFDPRIHAIRNHRGQRECAAALRSLLQGSPIRESHRNCSRVQDPYSLRCQPQVMGACLDALRHSAQVLLDEANGVSDNPLVFSDTGCVLSGGNFHAEPVALAADQMAIAIAEIGALAERRIALLIDRHLSELPPFLVENGGLHSGFMIAQVTAAALASENKHLASAVSVDSLPTSANQEDHVSMATYAARRLDSMLDNAERILGIELLAACQGIDFRRPVETSPPLQAIHHALRQQVSHYDRDRVLAVDIEAARMLLFDTWQLPLPSFLHASIP